MTIRSLLYMAARLIGDVNAVRRNRIPQRLAWRGIGSMLHNLMRKLIR